MTIVFNESGTNFAGSPSLEFVTIDLLTSPEPSSLLLCGLGLLAAVGCIVNRNRLDRVFTISRKSV